MTLGRKLDVLSTESDQPGDAGGVVPPVLGVMGETFKHDGGGAFNLHG